MLAGFGTAAAFSASATPEPEATPTGATTLAPIVAPGDAATHSYAVTEREAIEPEEIVKKDASLVKGTTHRVSRGDPGVAEVTYLVTEVHGVETDRVMLARVIVKQPTDDVVAHGTLSVPDLGAVKDGSNRAIGQQMAADKYGWDGIQWKCLDNLFTRESHWNERAKNPYSGAYGIPQALPGDKMASAGKDWKTNPATQIKWGLAYIKGRYHTPCGAWGAFNSRSPSWY